MANQRVDAWQRMDIFLKCQMPYLKISSGRVLEIPGGYFPRRKPGARPVVEEDYQKSMGPSMQKRNSLEHVACVSGRATSRHYPNELSQEGAGFQHKGIDVVFPFRTNREFATHRGPIAIFEDFLEEVGPISPLSDKVFEGLRPYEVKSFSGVGANRVLLY